MKNLALIYFSLTLFNSVFGQNAPEKLFIPYKTDAEKELLAQDFVHQQKDKWDLTFDAQGILTSGLMEGHNPLQDPKIEYIKVVEKFIESNARLLGVDPWGPYLFKLSSGFEGNVLVYSEEPFFYDELLERQSFFKYSVKLFFTVRNNQVTTFINQTEKINNVSDFNLKPKINFNAKVMLDKLIGSKMEYFGKTQMVETRPVSEKDLIPEGLVVSRKFGDKGITLELAWRFRVKIDRLSWEVDFSANTGMLLGKRALFF